jgi:divalent metal cation (Fe/Co/Zn/Cd) transporter
MTATMHTGEYLALYASAVVVALLVAFGIKYLVTRWQRRLAERSRQERLRANGMSVSVGIGSAQCACGYTTFGPVTGYPGSSIVAQCPYCKGTIEVLASGE